MKPALRALGRPRPSRASAFLAILACVAAALAAFAVAPSAALGSDATADLAVSIATAPDAVLAGQSITYTITVTNAGPDVATDVVLSDAFPLDATFVSLAAPPGWTCSTPAAGAAGPVSCSLDSLGVGSAQVFTLVLDVDSQAPGYTSIPNTAKVFSATDDPSATDNVASASTGVTPQADVSVTVGATPDPAAPGDLVTYKIAVADAGIDGSWDVTLSGAIPGSTELVSLAAPPGWTCTTPAAGDSGSFSCFSAMVGTGAPETFTLVVRVRPETPVGSSIVFTASAASSTVDPAEANNSGSATVEVAERADLSVTVSGAPNPVAVGGDVTYTIVVENGGPSSAVDVVLADALDPATAFESLTSPAGWTCNAPSAGGSGTVSCSAPSLLPGATARFTVVARVLPSATTGTTLSNSATVSGSNSDSQTADNAAAAVTTVGTAAGADVALTITATPQTVAPGSAITFTIAAENRGPGDAFDVAIAFPIPEHTTYVASASTAGATCTVPPAGETGTVSCEWSGATPAATSRVLTVVVRVDADVTTGTVVDAVATVTGAGVDPDSANNSAASPVSVAPVAEGSAADLAVANDNAATTVDTGSVFVFTVTVSNAGPGAAGSVVLAQPTPDGTRFVSVESSQGTCEAPPVGGSGQVVCSLGDVEAGGSATVTLSLNVTAGGGAVVKPTAVVSSAVSDPAPSNDVTTTSFDVAAGPDVLLTWDPPISTGDLALDPPLHLQASEATGRSAGAEGARSPRNTVIGYNVYRSGDPNVQTTPSNLFTSVPPSQTTVVASTAPSGSFFVVTAVYPNGESGPSNAASGGLLKPNVAGVALKGARLVVTGGAFTTGAQVFVDGIPFRKVAKVKGTAKVTQRGKMLTGQSVQQYLAAHGGVMLVSVRNADAGIGTFLYGR